MRRVKSILVLAALAIALLVPGAASAANGCPQGFELVNTPSVSVDRNGDGLACLRFITNGYRFIDNNVPE